MKFFSSAQRSILSFVVGVGTLITGQAAIAADTIVFRYGAFSEEISVPELAEFARTGQQSRTVRYYLKRTNQQPETVRSALNREIPVRVTTLDTVLRSPIGDYVLDRLSRTIETPVNAANKEALRGALVKSAGDSRISLIEMFQNYPTQQVYLDGRELINTYTEVSRLAQQVENLAAIFRYNVVR